MCNNNCVDGRVVARIDVNYSFVMGCTCSHFSSVHVCK